MTTPEIIKSLLEEKGMTQADLANQIGIRTETLSRILNGKQQMGTHTLQKIADALEVEVYELTEPKGYDDHRFEVKGYLDYCGAITRINSLKDLKKYVQKVESVAKYTKFKEKKLPKQSAITLADIDFGKWETIDATIRDVKSFRHHYDIIDDEQFNVGNMCPGFPFSLQGIQFNNSESAYIAGGFSIDTPEHIRIQEALIQNNDGYKAKKEFRNKRYLHLFRKDWEEFNVEWMKYVVWQKCKGNKDFAELLKKIPHSTMVVENSTGMTGATAQVWGCFNKELMELREAKEQIYLMQNPKANKDTLNIEANKWHHYGVWEGRNLMGKIIKSCSICLINGEELPIDYDLLRRKDIYLLGKKVSL